MQVESAVEDRWRDATQGKAGKEDSPRAAQPQGVDLSEHASNQPTGMKRYFLVLHDVSKKNNWGTLIRSASAFGCSGVIVQAKRRSDVSTFGAHGADKHVCFHFVASDTDVFTYAKQVLNCAVLGVEIKEEAVSINSSDFVQLCDGYQNVAVVLGNEGTGMHPSVTAKCDRFIYIPHYGAGTASLNVAVAGSIVFHRLASTWNLQERPRQGGKFVVEVLDVDKRRTLNVNSKAVAKDASENSDGRRDSSSDALNFLD